MGSGQNYTDPHQSPKHQQARVSLNKSLRWLLSQQDSSLATTQTPKPYSPPASAPPSHQTQTPPTRPNPTRGIINDQPLEDGVDIGIYKAILVGQNPVQKILKSRATVTVFPLGTGGIRNNRRPFQTENPSEYANRCTIQWHRVCIYPERLGKIAVQNAHPGSIMYIEGNLETKIFTDPITGLVRRLREIAVRKNGRIVFLGPVNGDEPAVTAGLRGVGYF